MTYSMEHEIKTALNHKYQVTFKTYSDIGSFLIRSVDENENIIKNSDVLIDNNYGDTTNNVFIMSHKEFEKFRDDNDFNFYRFRRITKRESFAVFYDDCHKIDEFMNENDFYLFSKKTRTESKWAEIYTLEKTMLIVDYDD